MNEKTVLLICQHFLPYTPAVGGVARVASLVEFLHDQGWRVFVLTSDGVDFGYLGYDHIVDKAEITYLEDPLKRKIQAGVRMQLQQAASDQGVGRLRMLRLMKSVAYELLIPDPGIAMRAKYISQARRLIDAFGIANVIVSSPPHSMQLVGSALKRRYGASLNYIVDYRDSWNTRQAFAQKTLLGRLIARRMERRVLACCDHFLYVSRPIIRKAEASFGLELERKSHLVMNGFDDRVCIEISRSRAAHDRLRIGHFGMLNAEEGSYRDIRPLLQVFEVYPELEERVQFEFYGQMKLEHDLRCPGMVFFDNLSYADARRKMLEMDALLLYHATGGDSDEVITGKFFEYVASQRPILCVSPEDMEARRLVEEYRLGAWADVDQSEQVIDMLLKLDAIMQETTFADVDVAAFGRSRQFEKILPLLRR